MRLPILLLPITLMLPACRGTSSGDDDSTEVADDDSTSTGDDDSSATGDDDTQWEEPPQFLARYDFRLVTLKNEQGGQFESVSGTMDVSVSTTQFLAELVTTGGQDWSWFGSLESNEQAFHVAGWYRPPGGAMDLWTEVDGNFQGSKGGGQSQNCLTGIGADDDPNYPDAGVKFAWYACQQAAPLPTINRAQTWSVTVTTGADNCGGNWPTTTWSETWSYNPGRILQVTRGGYTGYGVVSDDGMLFRYSMLEAMNPGRSLKVTGTFNPPLSNPVEGTGEGFCANPSGLIGAVMDMDYQ
jgi:hypothetical protein